VVIFLQFAPTFIILTISYEGLFYFAFCLTLFTWVRLEHQIYSRKHDGPPTSDSTTTTNLPKPAAPSPIVGPKDTTYRALTLSDARTALFFFYLVQSAFFSTGNIASVSSFSLDAVYRLIPVFDPWSQGALLLLKLMVPFAVMSANLGILNRRLGVAPSALFMIVMALGDVLTMNFFWMVRDEGSWLDIGSSISHFVIASLVGVFVAGLEVVSEGLIGGVDVGGGGEKLREGAKQSIGEVEPEDVGTGEVNGNKSESISAR
jgi:phosphatidylinositol glycan class N